MLLFFVVVVSDDDDDDDDDVVLVVVVTVVVVYVGRYDDIPAPARSEDRPCFVYPPGDGAAEIEDKFLVGASGRRACRDTETESAPEIRSAVNYRADLPRYR